MLKMVDGTGIIGVDMICPLGVSTPQPPNYDRVELEGAGMLVLPNSLDAPLERLELGGKTEQVQTTGKNLLPDKFSIYTEGKSKTNLKLQIGNYVYSSKTSKNLYILHEDKSNITNGWTATNKFNFKIDKEETIEVRIETENPLEILPMIREETELDSYEPYTGGKPSPSPEYPQEIKNSGKWNEGTQKYEVDVKITGKNLFNREKAKDESNWKHISGYNNYPIYVGTGNKVTFSYLEKLNTGLPLYFGVGFKESSISEYMYHATTPSLIANKKTLTATGDHAYLIVSESNVPAFLDAIQTFQVEISPTQTDYAPYKEQTLTLTSDRPITKWDKLIEQGEEIGWLYNSARIILDGTKSRWVSSNKPENLYFANTIVDAYGGKGASFCKTYRNIQDSAYEIKYANERCIYSDHPTYTSGDKFFRAPNENVTTLEQWKELIDENPIEMLYHTKNSEFVPLPQEEQDAIRALKTYYPTTVITADGGELDPDIKVTYRKEI